MCIRDRPGKCRGGCWFAIFFSTSSKPQPMAHPHVAHGVRRQRCSRLLSTPTILDIPLCFTSMGGPVCMTSRWRDRAHVASPTQQWEVPDSRAPRNRPVLAFLISDPRVSPSNNDLVFSRHESETLSPLLEERQGSCTSWFKLTDPNFVIHECGLQYLREWHIFGIILTALGSDRQFLSSGPTAGALAAKLCPNQPRVFKRVNNG